MAWLQLGSLSVQQMGWLDEQSVCVTYLGVWLHLNAIKRSQRLWKNRRDARQLRSVKRRNYKNWCFLFLHFSHAQTKSLASEAVSLGLRSLRVESEFVKCDTFCLVLLNLNDGCRLSPYFLTKRLFLFKKKRRVVISWICITWASSRPRPFRWPAAGRVHSGAAWAKIGTDSFPRRPSKSKTFDLFIESSEYSDTKHTRWDQEISSKHIKPADKKDENITFMTVSNVLLIKICSLNYFSISLISLSNLFICHMNYFVLLHMQTLKFWCLLCLRGNTDNKFGRNQFYLNKDPLLRR